MVTGKGGDASRIDLLSCCWVVLNRLLFCFLLWSGGATSIFVIIAAVALLATNLNVVWVGLSYDAF